MAEFEVLLTKAETKFSKYPSIRLKIPRKNFTVKRKLFLVAIPMAKEMPVLIFHWSPPLLHQERSMR